MNAPGGSPWGTLPYVLEHFAVAVAAVSGVLAARGKQVDLFGVWVLALVTAVGGGTVRDLMVGDFPLVWIRDPSFLATASVAALITFVGARLLTFRERWLLVADAIALGLMTMVGAKKGVALGLAPAISVAMGVITGVVGGMVRDVLTGEIPMVLRPQIHLYATAAMAGAIVYVSLASVFGISPPWLVIGALVTLLLRLAALRWRLGLPVFTDRTESSKRSDSPQ